MDLFEVHRQFAVEYNNKTWDFFDIPDRTEEQTLEMIHMAHTSRFHWGIVGNAINLERGEWLVSRAYAEAHISERAIFHGLKCLEICEKNGIGNFDIAFAHEGLARAYAVAKDQEKFETHKQKAIELGEKIEEAGDRDYFMSQINSIEL